VDAIIARGRTLLHGRLEAPTEKLDLLGLSEALLSQRGEASGVAIASMLLQTYAQAPLEERKSFVEALLSTFGANHARVDQAVEKYWKGGNDADIAELHAAAEPRRQELFRRINLADGGTAGLVRMREDVMSFVKQNEALRLVDADFVHLLSSWFNRGFLVLKRIDWRTPGNILEKIKRYEAVHAIAGWDELRSRIEPPDRRCYAFFHPQLADEPLIFVEVALTTGVPEAIAPLLSADRNQIMAANASTAVFYSISNTQRGLSGVSFGSFLIKQVVEDLKRELPNLNTFVTLSPVPGFAAWLEAQLRNERSSLVPLNQRGELLSLLDDAESVVDETALAQAAAIYLICSRNSSGMPSDPVARFHLGNGASLERINVAADRSPNGIRQSFGVMVNYLYDLNQIERNHEAFVSSNELAVSSRLRKLVTDMGASGNR